MRQQPFRFHAAQRIPHRRAAHVEPLGQILLHHALAGLEHAIANRFVHSQIGCLGQRHLFGCLDELHSR